MVMTHHDENHHDAQFFRGKQKSVSIKLGKSDQNRVSAFVFKAAFCPVRLHLQQEIKRNIVKPSE